LIEFAVFDKVNDYLIFFSRWKKNWDKNKYHPKGLFLSWGHKIRHCQGPSLFFSKM